MTVQTLGIGGVIVLAQPTLPVTRDQAVALSIALNDAKLVSTDRNWTAYRDRLVDQTESVGMGYDAAVLASCITHDEFRETVARIATDLFPLTWDDQS